MADVPLFNASICDGIVTGHCVMLEDNAAGDQEIVYAGPIKGAPNTGGKMVLLNSADFGKLKAVVDRGRH